MDGLESSVNVVSLGINGRDAHVAESEVLCVDSLEETSGKSDTLGGNLGQEVGESDALGEVDAGEAVGAKTGLGDDFQTPVVDLLLDLVRHLLVVLEPLIQRGAVVEDLLEGDLQGVHVLHGGGGEVGGLSGLVGLHDGQPLLQVAKVDGDLGLALDLLDGSGRGHGDGEAGGGTDGLLGGGQDKVESPVVKGDGLNSDGADTVNDNQSLGGDLVDELGDGLDVNDDTGRGINVGQGDDVVLLLLEGSLDLGKRRSLSSGGRQNSHVVAEDLEAVSKGIGEEAGGDDKSLFVSLEKVGSNNLPAEGSSASNDKGLGLGVGGLEEGSQVIEHRAKDLDELGRVVGHGLVRHGGEDLLVKLDGAGDHGNIGHFVFESVGAGVDVFCECVCVIGLCGGGSRRDNWNCTGEVMSKLSDSTQGR